MIIQLHRVLILSKLFAFTLVTFSSPVVRAQNNAPPAGSLDQARLSEAVYNPTKRFLQTNGFEQIRANSSSTGFKYAVYERERNGVTERILAFAGTDGLLAINDMWANIEQAITGNSAQYSQALNIAVRELVLARRDGAVFGLTGHSLGGGLAQSTSEVLQIPATVFEAAGIGGDRALGDAPVTNIQMDNDLVPTWGEQLGEQYELDHPGLIAHGIGEVIKLLEGQGAVDSWWDTKLNQASNFDSLKQGEQKILRTLIAKSQLNSLQKYESVIDAQFDNLQRFQVGAFRNTQAFSFTTPTSTGGFIDVRIPSTSDFLFRVLDTEIQDGDIIQLNLASGSGAINLGTIPITNAGQTLPPQPVAAGPVELRIRALNEGSLSPNTGGLRILSPVLSGPKSQNFDLNQGETGTLRVIVE